MSTTENISATDWQRFCDERLQNVPLAQLPQKLKLPRTPRAVAEFIRLADSPEADITKIAGLIETDPELTAHVLRLVNSCASGLTTKVYSVRHAICLLGLRRSRMMVMSAALQSAMRSSPWYLAHGERFQSEYLERALFARNMAEVLGLDTDVAYAAGLVQDLLLPFLMDCSPQQYQCFEEWNVPLQQCEKQQFGWSHAETAAHLLKGWNFPEEVIACVLMHHETELVLADERLRRSNLMATAAAALLPDSLRQEPTGISLLMRLQDELPYFDFLEVAARVDDQFETIGALHVKRTPLSERLGTLALAQIDGRPVDNWVGRNIGPYVIDQRLGEGGMGVVYRARHSALRRHAAVKLMKTSRLDALQLESFEHEAEVTAALTSPHTTTIFDYGQTATGTPFFVMEFLSGMNLWQLVDEFGPQPESRVIHVLRQVCFSLAEAHSKGLIHRDVKPENIVLSQHGGVFDFVKVLDFGLATLISQQSGGAIQQANVCGTPHYMAPEAILSPAKVDERTDVYALGAVGYWLLTGCNLFEDEDVPTVLHKQLSEIPAAPSVRAGRPIAEDLEAVIMRCLEKNTYDRPYDAQQLSDLLSHCSAADKWTSDSAREWWDQHAASAKERLGRDAFHSSMMTDQNRASAAHARGRDTMTYGEASRSKTPILF